MLLFLLFSVIISALFIYLQILSFMLILNTLRLTIILYETELQRKRFRFTLSSLMINLSMFLPSLFLLLRLLLFDSNCKSILHPQLEGVYYRMYLYRKYYRYTIQKILQSYSCVATSTITIIYCHIHMYRKGWLTNRLNLPIILNYDVTF